MAAQLTGRGGRGGPLVGPNAQVFPKTKFDGTSNKEVKTSLLSSLILHKSSMSFDLILYSIQNLSELGLKQREIETEEGS